MRATVHEKQVAALMVVNRIYNQHGEGISIIIKVQGQGFGVELSNFNLFKRADHQLGCFNLPIESESLTDIEKLTKKAMHTALREVGVNFTTLEEFREEK